MFHKPVFAAKKGGDEDEEDVYEIVHLERAGNGGGNKLSGLNLIPLNKKLALTCGKEETKSILCNRTEPGAAAAARARSNSTNRKLNAFLSVFKAPQSPQLSGPCADEEENDFQKRADPNLKVNFAPLPSRESKCKVACGLAARAQLLNPGRTCRQGRYTGPTPRMVPRRSSSVPGTTHADDATSLSRRNTSYEPSENQLEAGPALGRRHTSSEVLTDASDCLSRRRSLPPPAEEVLLDEGTRGRAVRVVPEAIEEEDSARPDLSRNSSVSWETTEEGASLAEQPLTHD